MMAKQNKIFSLFFIIFTIIFNFTTSVQSKQSKTSPNWVVGNIYNGFKLLRSFDINEINAHALRFEHVKTGATLVKLETNDNNKAFCITFKTLPHNDTGVAHVLEHSVLDGSRKYPVKGPFNILQKGSLHTFLNAMTAADHTMYPVASINEKDFFNLMDVYLDAVFYPRIYTEPKILKQEGWRYELNSKDDDIQINGVVYNEMKGAFSSPLSILETKTQKMLFPDTIYAKESGGDPEHIPELTQADFEAFHKKYYHPSNSYIFLYGDGDTLKELKFINDNYLKNFNHKLINNRNSTQKPFSKMHEAIFEYPISNSEKKENKTFLQLSFVPGNNDNLDFSFAVETIAKVLNAEGSLLRKNILSAGLGKDISVYFTDNLPQLSLDILLKNANESDAPKFKEIVFNTLKQIAKDGFDRKVIEGILNRREFLLREADYGRFPKGLMYNFMTISGWQYSNKPFRDLQFEKVFTKLRETLKTKKLENILKKNVIQNNHSVFIILKPSPGLEEKKEEALKAKLSALKASLSKKELEKMIADTKALKKFQATPDKPEDIAKIPLLTLKDISPTTQWYEIEKNKIDKTPLLFYPGDTNQIIYVQFYFDAKVVPPELIQYTHLLAETFGKMSTSKKTYDQLTTELNLNTGSAFAEPELLLKNSDENNFLPYFLVNMKTLKQKLPASLSLIAEVLMDSQIDDKKRLKEVISMHRADLEQSLSWRASWLASIRLASYLSSYGKYDELDDGLSYIQFIKDLDTNFTEKADDIIANLKKVSQLLFSTNNLTISLTTEKQLLPYVSKHIKRYFLEKLPNTKKQQFNYNLPVNDKNEALVSTSKIQHVMEGYNFKKLGFKYNGHMLVARQIITNGYLHQKIRVLGGAYGAFSVFKQSGDCLFGSYRDPHLKQTLETFNGISDYVKTFSATEEEMTRYIIGTISKLDQPLTVSGKGWLAVQNYLQEKKKQNKQKERNEVLSTTVNDIRELAPLIKKVIEQNYICVFANEKKAKEHKELFRKIVNVNVQ